MRTVVRGMIVLAILIAIALLLYLYDSSSSTYVRFINYVRDSESMQIIYNQQELSYQIDFGVASEYLPLQKGLRILNSVLTFENGRNLEIRASELYPTALQSILVIGTIENPKWIVATTPVMQKKNETAIRFVFINDLLDSNWSVKLLAGDAKILTDEFANSELSRYYKIPADRYRVQISQSSRDGQLLVYSAYLTAGESYTAILDEIASEYQPEMRLFVDNRPGDHYIALMPF